MVLWVDVVILLSVRVVWCWFAVCCLVFVADDGCCWLMIAVGFCLMCMW